MVAERAPVHELPPRDERAEVQAIGAVLLAPAVWAAKLCGMLEPEDFYTPRAQAVWRTIEAMHAASEPIDVVTVSDRLAANGLPTGLDPVDVVRAYLVPTASDAEWWASRVLERAHQRKIASLCLKAGSPTTDPGEAVEKARRLGVEFTKLGEGVARDVDSVEPIGRATGRAFTRLERITTSGQIEKGLPTDLLDLDELTGGMRPEELIYLGARPSVGKSALALTIALNVAKAGTMVQLESLEMGERQVAHRLMSQLGRIPATRIRDGSLWETDWPDLIEACAELDQIPIRACYRPARTIGEIATAARRGVEHHQVKLLVIDYLGLIQVDQPGETRRHEVEHVSRSLKQLARELTIPILCLAQLNRQQDARSKADRKPRLSDLRETGQIEADADQVWLLDRPLLRGQGDDGDDPAKACLIVAKNREGETGELNLVYRADLTQFRNWASN